MDDDKKARINEVMDALRRELRFLQQSDGPMKLKVRSTPEHAERLRSLSEELRSLTGGGG